MKFKLDIKRELKIGAALLVVAAIIAFAERRNGMVAVRDVTIKMENVHENHFLDEADIAEMIQLKKDNLKGAGLDKINLKEIERKIKREPFIEDAQVYSDLKGNVVVRSSLRRPIARIVRNDGPDGYIAEDGTIMPVSDKYTSRVLLLSGAYVPKLLKQTNLTQTEEGLHLLEMIKTIRESEFWSAQIAQLDIDGKGKVIIFPQVGDEKIEFGKPENLEVKFSKLMVFYKEILPRMGWNKYQRVNLEYEGQIVAE
ncbi:MAG: cell division protein FtsQ [Cyclobacteriaceae bacterium]|nr:cell division protein FtsQ [Cyclobacteriaceae bacterium]